MTSAILGKDIVLPPALDNRIIVKSSSQITGVIDSTKEYFIDGDLDLAGETITVPSTGMTIRGHGFDISRIFTTSTNGLIFDGGGTLNLIDIALSASGSGGRVFDMLDPTGFNAVEMTRINFNDCTSLGTLSGFRQGLEDGCGRFGGQPELTLAGNWIGGYRATTCIVRSLAAGFTGSLFAAGSGFMMNNRFLSDMNIDLPASASFINFSPANFANPETLQLQNCIISRNGNFDNQDANVMPNISASDVASIFRKNKGIENTFVGGKVRLTAEVETTIPAVNTFVNFAGTWSSIEFQHFDNPSAEQLRNVGEGIIEFEAEADLIIEGGQGDLIAVRLMRRVSSSASDVIIEEEQRIVNNFQGGRDVAFLKISSNVTLEQNDYVFLLVANLTGATNITLEAASTFKTKER